MFDSARDYWETLSERERRMLSIMGGTVAAVLVFVAVWTTSSAVAEVEEERDAIRAVLREIDRSSELLAKRQAERLAMEARYQVKPPGLGALLETRAKEQKLDLGSSVEEPEKALTGYTRRSVRVGLRGVQLRPLMHLLASIEQESAPIAIERLIIEHYTPGDSYKVDLGVSAFEKSAKKSSTKPEKTGAQ